MSKTVIGGQNLGHLEHWGTNKKIFQLGRCWSEVFSSVKVQVKVIVQELQVQVKTR